MFLSTLLAVWLSIYPIHWNAPKHCLNSTLADIIEDVADESPVIVRSTCRSKAYNRKVGGAKRSYHLHGAAVDFTIRSNKWRTVLAKLLADKRVGGYKMYRAGVFHIDIGPRRTWGNKNHVKTRYASLQKRTSKHSSHSSNLNVFSDTFTRISYNGG